MHQHSTAEVKVLPQLKSRYCPMHTPTVFTPEGEHSASAGASETATLQTVTRQEDQVEQTTFYEVLLRF